MKTKYHLILAIATTLAPLGLAKAAANRPSTPDRRMAWPGLQTQAAASTPGITDQPDDQDVEVMKKKKKKKKKKSSAS